MPQISRPSAPHDLPAAVIAGFPKCGTTSLFDWLASHPAICGASTKEPTYLIDRDNDDYQSVAPRLNYHEHGLEGYRSFFSHRRADQLTVEATPAYVFQRTALDVLSEMSTSPLIFFVVRRPSRRLYSLFRFAKHHAAVLDRQMGFAEFVEMLGRADHPFLRTRPVLRNALRHGHYINYVERWLERCGRDRIHVITLDRMRARPQTVMKEMAAALDIPPDGFSPERLRPSNPTRAVRAQWLQRLLRRRRPALRDSALRRLARRAYYRVNFSTDSESESESDRRLMQEIDVGYRASNQRLADRFDLDLSTWN